MSVRVASGRGARRLPALLLPSLRGYRREWLAADALAGLTLLVIAIPEQLATSRLAGMPPITGYYAFIAATLMFALFGSNPRMSVGADSTIAPLFAVGVARLAPVDSRHYVQLVAILAVAVGLMVLLVGVLRLGWIAEFLSEPIIAGFLGGVAVTIVIHQLPDLLGLPATSGSPLHRVDAIARHLGSARVWTLAIGLAVLVVVVALERVNRRLPAALVALVGSALAVGLGHLRRHGVAVLGHIAHGAPHFGLAGLSWSAVGRLLPLAAVVALVVVSQSAATTRAFPNPAGEDIEVDRDFFGIGVGSVAAGLIGAFPVNASPPRTGAVVASGGRTQVAGLGAAAALVLLIPAAGVLANVPVATLAAVLIFVAARIFPLRELMTIARFNLVEFGLAVITLLTVALVGIEQGIGVAVGLAILDRTRLAARPQLHVLGRIAGTTSWAPLSSSEHPEQMPGVLVVLFATPLWYANATHFRSQMRAALHRAPGRLRVVVLDAIGMSDIDFTGTRALAAVLDEFDRQQLTFAVARAGAHVRSGLHKSGLLDRIGPDRLFDTVGEAVAALAPTEPTEPA